MFQVTVEEGGVRYSFIDNVTEDERTRLLIAGRRAAVNQLRSEETLQAWNGPTVEQYDGTQPIVVNGLDIGGAIDAAVLEIMVRMQPAAPPKPIKPRVWWRFW